jgi:hypothetical protein
MKTSFLLLETIFSFLIMSMVFLFSTILYKNILSANTKEFEDAIIRADLLSTQLFIAKQLKNGVVIETTQKQIRFYALDNEAFLQGFYSGMIDLNESSKNKAYTPLSQTTQLESTHLLFENHQLHELVKSPENNFLYFKNSSAKTLFEHYKIVKGISTIHLNDNRLYFNQHLLQENIQQFAVTAHNHKIKVNICMHTLCEEWIF